MSAHVYIPALRTQREQAQFLPIFHLANALGEVSCQHQVGCKSHKRHCLIHS